jgi:hypothetical protein
MNKEISIICLGSWNNKVYTPNMVANKVFNLPIGANMGININQNTFDCSFVNDTIVFSPFNNSLQFRCTQNPSMDEAKKMNDFFLSSMKLQPWAPLTAFGYNITLNMSAEEFSASPLSGAFPSVGVGRFNPSKIEYRSKDGNGTHKLIISNENGNYTVNYNLENTKLSDEVIEKGLFSILNDDVINIMGEQYGL